MPLSVPGLPLEVVVAQELVDVDRLVALGMEQVFDRRLVTDFDAPLQLIPRRPEPGAPHQMRHQRNVFVVPHRAVLLELNSA